MSGRGAEDRAPLTGRWVRTGEVPPLRDLESVAFGHDPAMLPGEIEFSGSRFRSTRAPGQGFTVWDVGSYRVDGDELSIDLANDATGRYSVSIGEDEFTVTDATGTTTTYRRMS